MWTLIFTRFSTAFGHKNDSYPIECKKGAMIHGMTTGTKSNQIGRPPSQQMEKGFKKNGR